MRSILRGSFSIKNLKDPKQGGLHGLAAGPVWSQILLATFLRVCDLGGS